MEGFPSGQRGQTVNLLSTTSVVRIHHLPPKEKAPLVGAFSFGQVWIRKGRPRKRAGGAFSGPWLFRRKANPPAREAGAENGRHHLSVLFLLVRCGFERAVQENAPGARFPARGFSAEKRIHPLAKRAQKTGGTTCRCFFFWSGVDSKGPSARFNTARKVERFRCSI